MLSPTTFLREVKQEMTKVSWPSRTQTQNMTLVVIGVSAFVGLYIGLLDTMFQKLMEVIL